jgi:hypothetical protein
VPESMGNAASVVPQGIKPNSNTGGQDSICIIGRDSSNHTSLSIIRMIKSRKMRWAGHVARMGEKTNAYRLLV